MKRNFPSVPSMPPTEDTVRVFIHVMKREGRTFNTLRNYIAAIRHYFSEQGGFDPTKKSSFKKFMNGIRREMLGDTPPNRKLAVLVEHMEKFASLANENNSFEVQTMALFSLMFFGFLRISEAWKLHVSDICFSQGTPSVTVKIRSSKTDVNGRSTTIYIEKGEKSYDCYKWLQLYMNQNFSNVAVDMKLFPISIAEIRKRIHDKFQSIGIDPKDYSGHSFRRGGAHAASLAGVQDCAIQKHGRWLSDCYTIYTSVEMQHAGKEVSIKL